MKVSLYRIADGRLDSRYWWLLRCDLLTSGGLCRKPMWFDILYFFFHKLIFRDIDVPWWHLIYMGSWYKCVMYGMYPILPIYNLTFIVYCSLASLQISRKFCAFFIVKMLFTNLNMSFHVCTNFIWFRPGSHCYFYGNKLVDQCKNDAKLFLLKATSSISIINSGLDVASMQSHWCNTNGAL